MARCSGFVWIGSVLVASVITGCSPAAAQLLTDLSSESPARDCGSPIDGSECAPPVVPSENDAGMAFTMNANGGPVVDARNPFYQSLGSNGRSCASCHRADSGMTIGPTELAARFDATEGLDPIFRTNDGSVSPLADVSTLEARRDAFAMLLSRGVIRVGIPMPANAEFELVSVTDPYGFASAAELSLFRRPLPTTNLKFLSTVMWDGRETFTDSEAPGGMASIHFDLSDQANGATLGHAQSAQPLTDDQRNAIVDFETSIYTAQVYDNDAGLLFWNGARGGPGWLATESYYPGINDPGSPGYSPTVMTAYDGWSHGHHGTYTAAQRSVARGEALFNTHPIEITGVPGLNDGGSPVVQGTCTTCHDAPNAGSHSRATFFAVGVSDDLPVGGLDVSGLPVYVLRELATGKTKAVTDPGRALITGKWDDVGAMKVPTLRGIETRSPYFHNGSATELDDVVEFYNQRFLIGFTQEEKDDLVAFLKTL